MNIILLSSDNSYSDAGLNYFLSLYGFQSSHMGNKIPIQIVNFKNPIITDNQIHGWITWNGNRIPVLQRPADLTGQGKELLSFTAGTITCPCAVIQDHNIIISLDIFFHLGLFISGYMEEIWNTYNMEKKEIISVPFADYYCDFLFSCILTAQKNTRAPLVLKSFWPDGKSCAVCLTHDVDEVKKTYQWITYPLKLIRRGKLEYLIPQFRSLIQKVIGYEPYWTFNKIMRIEGSRGIRSSFYFLKETGKVRISDKKTWRHLGRRYDFNDTRVRELLRDLNSGGWEAGLHGSFYSYLDSSLLYQEKEALEHALGSLVIGGRQHNLNLKIPETWLHQEEVGLVYDTTLGFNDSLGFRWGISFPFRPYYPKESRNLRILQIPLAIEDLPYFRFRQPFDQFLRIFKNVESTHGVLTLLWHHSVFNENEFPGWESDYLKILDYCKEHNAWIGSGRQIHEWWTQREKSTIDWDFNGTHLRIVPCPLGKEHFITVYLPDFMKIEEMKNATIICSDSKSCEITTNNLKDGEYIEITFSKI